MLRKFVCCSYRVEHAIMNPFQSSGSLYEFKTHKNLAHAIDVHRKGMESVFIIAKYNIEVMNINYNSSNYVKYMLNYNIIFL